MNPEQHYTEAQNCLNLIKERAGEDDFGYDQANTLTFSALAHSVQGILQWLLNPDG